VVAPLGAGGMGEVYRAKDPRLGREVAVKVLPASFSKDPDRLRRFEHEARAAGVLNHPNITAVYDIGSHDGSPYVVSELLEGETLRSRLATGALSPRKALDYAIQIARGLAAAHEKGIVHRDLKPENLFITKDGRVKILDFGLAKLKQPEPGMEKLTELPTGTAGTEPGVVLGTMGYMSPEQVRGQPADRPSDLFSFGAILYEMLSGQRAFRGDTAADTITAILAKEPPDLSATNREIHPGLDRIVRHCLEKNPEERFESARDLAFDLEALSGISAPALVPRAAPVARRPGLLWFLVPVALLIAAGGGVIAGRRMGRDLPSFHQLTFRRGVVPSGRFAPDGRTILYSAAWEGNPMEIFMGTVDAPEFRSFGLAGSEILSVSRSGELAISLRRRIAAGFVRTGTLARVSAAGGPSPREILEEVHWADWSPDGQSLAVVRDVGPLNRLEYPIGTVLYQTSGWISHLRVSPRGDRVAFIDHPVKNDDAGTVAVVDRRGNRKTLSRTFGSAQGLAWSPSRDEIWFTAAALGNRDLHSVTLSGHETTRARVAGSLTLHDISADGRALITRETMRIGTLGLSPGADKERELSWLDWSLVRDLSSDGRTYLFVEGGEGGGPGYSFYLRQMDGSPPIRLGEGSGESISPDGKWVLAIIHPTSDAQLMAYPTGAGEIRKIPSDSLKVQIASWTPDGRQIVFSANEPEHGIRIYVRDFVGGKPRAVSPEGYSMFRRTVSPDGRFVVATGPDQKIYLYPLAGGEPTPVPGAAPGDTPVRWTADGRAVIVFRRNPIPVQMIRLDVATGHREVWRELVPADSAGVTEVGSVIPTSDGRSYVYSYIRQLSDLYVVDGLK
jgi:Tol biopolymer transport system component/predicted Ser/Thr protein kinase